MNEVEIPSETESACTENRSLRRRGAGLRRVIASHGRCHLLPHGAGLESRLNDLPVADRVSASAIRVRISVGRGVGTARQTTGGRKEAWI